jgi:hypothetical protein
LNPYSITSAQLALVASSKVWAEPTAIKTTHKAKIIYKRKKKLETKTTALIFLLLAAGTARIHAPKRYYLFSFIIFFSIFFLFFFSLSVFPGAKSGFQHIPLPPTYN